MHITYDLPVSIDDILEAKQRLGGKNIKQACPVRIILASAARAKYFLNSKICSARVHLKFAAPLINCAV